MSSESLTLSGIHYGRLFVQNYGNAVSLMISPMDGVNNPQVIGLNSEQAKQLANFLIANVGTKD